MVIALDAMGGDHGPAVTVPAAVAALERFADLELVLVGQQEAIDAALAAQRQGDRSRLHVRHASQTVGMDESPAQALRGKKDSSMRVAINMVRDHEADACVSAGNTGALMATARFVLKTLPGIDRPAIVSMLPSLNGHVHMLDLGANVDSPPALLLQFGIMGSILVRYVEGVAAPSVALLNIGVEDIKGNDTVREASSRLAQTALNYVGFIEADRIHEGVVDVVVADGFSGNVALKSMEGTARLIRYFLEKEFKSGAYGRVAGAMAWPVLKSLSAQLDPRRYNGASLVGLNGIVIKSHGGADHVAFQQAVQTAVIEAEKRVPERIRHLLDEQVR